MPIVAKLEKPAETPIEESHGATIVPETSLPVVAEPAASKSESPEKLAKLDSELTKKKIVEQQPAAHAVGEKTAKSEKTAVNDNAAHTNTAPAKSQAKVSDTAKVHKHTKTETTKNTKDEDVDLIAALLTRISHQDASAKDAKNKKSTTSTTPNATTSNAKRQNKTEPSRDIVTRTEGDTTESLLKRCKALGFFEGELCRVRICSTVWGKDPACPAPEQVAMPNQN